MFLLESKVTAVALGLTWLSLVAAGMASCTPDDEVSDTPNIDGTTVGSSGPPHGVVEVEVRPRVTLPLRSDTSAFFHLVVDGTVLSDGSIAIADRGRDQVLMFDSRGRLEHVLGGKGEGPGEFGSLARMTSRGFDTLELWESRAERSAAYGPDGTLYWDRPGPVGPVTLVSEWFVAPGRTVFALKLDRGSVTPPAGVVRPERPLVRWNGTGDLDTLAVFQGPSRMYIEAGRPFPEPIGTLFGADVEVAAGGSPWRLAVGDGAVARFMVLDSLGREIRTVSWQPGWWELDGEAVQMERQRRVEEEVGGRGREPGQAASTIRQLPDPRAVPVFRQLFVDDMSNVWVERFPHPAASSSLWSVFDSTGTWTMDVKLPEVSRLLHVDERGILALAIDSLDVHEVRLFDLDWPEARDIGSSSR